MKCSSIFFFVWFFQECCSVVQSGRRSTIGKAVLQEAGEGCDLLGRHH